METVGGETHLDFAITHKVTKSNYINHKEQICLRLYSVDKNGNKFVGEKSGLNQWNASGRKRDDDELYIPYLTIDRKRNKSFFPPRDTAFDLIRVSDGVYKMDFSEIGTYEDFYGETELTEKDDIED